jgi:hypothetical protein
MRIAVVVALILASAGSTAAQESSFILLLPSTPVESTHILLPPKAPVQAAEPLEAHAPEPSPIPLSRGDRIRINAPRVGDPLVSASVLAVRGSQIGFAIGEGPGQVYTRNLLSVDTLDVRGRSRRDSARSGALWGLFLGASGGMIGAPFAEPALPWDTGPTIAVLGGAGGLAGAMVGAAVGAVIDPPRWYRYILR